MLFPINAHFSYFLSKLCKKSVKICRRFLFTSMKSVNFAFGNQKGVVPTAIRWFPTSFLLVPWMSGLVNGLQNRLQQFESARHLHRGKLLLELPSVSLAFPHQPSSAGVSKRQKKAKNLLSSSFFLTFASTNVSSTKVKLELLKDLLDFSPLAS